MSEELKPCPFCGGDATFTFPNSGTMRYVYCLNDTCYARPTVSDSSEERAIRVWNRRAIPAEHGKCLQLIGHLSAIMMKQHPNFVFDGSGECLIDWLTDDMELLNALMEKAK